MARDDHGDGPRIEPARVERYLRRHGFPDAHLIAVQPLGVEVQVGLKGYGYGRPLRVTFTAGGATHDRVVRTMAPDPFDHERRADRFDVMLLAYDTFNALPRHIRAFDVGAFGVDGELTSMARGEAFLVTEYVEGDLYARDLQKLRGADAPGSLDRDRAEALARYLATVHSVPAPPGAYARCLRDTVGSGEGIFGLCDSYPKDHPIARPERLQAIEQAAVRWRWRLADRAGRARRTHGDFHPFNLLFREGTDFSVLDRSRGGAGEPADDLTALTINYLFFDLVDHGAFDGALRALWEVFWHTWLRATGDREVLEVVAPFFAWRGLVVASPVWYPDVPDGIRDRLLCFVERLLDGAPFDPDRVDDLLS
ncbi:MAG: phosphotransferase [Myxococcales bacterium]|nr:phosphotransferase [Myxococcales bacterium]